MLTFVEVEPCAGGQVLDHGIGLKQDLAALLDHWRQCKHCLQVLSRGRVAKGKGGVLLQGASGEQGGFLQACIGEEGAIFQGYLV